MGFGDGDLAVFCADTGVAVVFGGLSAVGLLDVASNEFVIGNASVRGAEYKLTLPFNAYPTMPDVDDALTVDGKHYQVRGRDNGEHLDGRFYEYLLKVIP